MLICTSFLNHGLSRLRVLINRNNTNRSIIALISELKPLVQEIGDATLIVPLIKEYMEIMGFIHVNINSTVMLLIKFMSTYTVTYFDMKLYCCFIPNMKNLRSFYKSMYHRF